MTTEVKNGDVKTDQLFAALVKAQERCHSAPKDAINTEFRFKYASAEAIIIEAKAAIAGTGLLLVPAHATTELRDVVPQYPSRKQQEGGTAVPNPNELVKCLFLVRSLELVHAPSGERISFRVEWPVVPGPGRPVDKAVASALTTSLAYFYRDLLAMPRVNPDDDMDRDPPQPDRRAPEPQVQPRDQAARQFQRPAGFQQQRPAQQAPARANGPAAPASAPKSPPNRNEPAAPASPATPSRTSPLPDVARAPVSAPPAQAVSPPDGGKVLAEIAELKANALNVLEDVWKPKAIDVFAFATPTTEIDRDSQFSLRDAFLAAAGLELAGAKKLLGELWTKAGFTAGKPVTGLLAWRFVLAAEEARKAKGVAPVTAPAKTDGDLAGAFNALGEQAKGF